jgi:hypothetical protein
LGKLVSPKICVGQFNHQNYLGLRCKPNSLSQTSPEIDGQRGQPGVPSESRAFEGDDEGFGHSGVVPSG